MFLYVLEMGLHIREDAPWAHGLYLEPFSLCHLKGMCLGQETDNFSAQWCIWVHNLERKLCVYKYIGMWHV